MDAGPARRRPRRETGQTGPAGGRRCGRCSRAAGFRPVETNNAGVPVGLGRAGLAAAGSGAARSTVRRVQGQFAGLAELAVPHHQPPGGEVDVAAVERDRFTDPHSGDRQQPDQGGERGPPQRGAQRAGGGDQRGDVGVGIQVRAGPQRPLRQQIRGGHLVRRVERVQVGGEAAHRRQPVGPPVRAAVGGQPRPVQRRRHGDPRTRRSRRGGRGTGRAASPGGPAGSPARGAAPDSRPARRAASPVTTHRRSRRRGQGRASTASASRSTLA